MKPGDREGAYQWLRQNPHRLHLGRLAFRFLDESGEELDYGHAGGFRQKLDLWTGVLSSRFTVRGVPVDVTTVCHPDADMLGVKVVSPLVGKGQLQVFIRFPAPDMTNASWSKSVKLDWANDHRHETVLLRQEDGAAWIERTMDEDRYAVRWQWSGGGSSRRVSMSLRCIRKERAKRLSTSWRSPSDLPRVRPLRPRWKT